MIDIEIKTTLWEEDGQFNVEEFGSGRFHLTKKGIVTLCRWRNWHGIPTQITSAYRHEGSHKYGNAFDVLLWEKWRKKQPDIDYIWRVISNYPWMGKGIYFDWEDGIGLHVDMCTPHKRPRPKRWIRSNNIYYYEDLKSGKFWAGKPYESDVTSLELEKEIDR